MSDGRAKKALIFLVTLISLIVLSSVFYYLIDTFSFEFWLPGSSSVGDVPQQRIQEGETESPPAEIHRVYLPETISVREKVNLSSTPLFLVKGARNTPYLRVAVYSEYDNGTWFLEKSDPQIYAGDKITVTSVPGNSVTDTIAIIPLSNFTGINIPLPTAKYTSQIVAERYSSEILYYPNQMYFLINGSLQGYTFKTVHYVLSTEDLSGRRTIALDEKYLQVPDSLPRELWELAENITRGISTSYGKIIAIERFLLQNYVYDDNCTLAPEGVDPVEWFLLYSKRGSYIDFASAFVILARMNKIPARLVTGYLVKPGVEYIVRAKDSHAWAEVYFEDYGWVSFDPSPRWVNNREVGFAIKLNPDTLEAEPLATYSVAVEIIAPIDFREKVDIVFRAPEGFEIDHPEITLLPGEKSLVNVTLGDVTPGYYLIEAIGVSESGIAEREILVVIVKPRTGFFLKLNTSSVVVPRGEIRHIDIDVLPLGNYSWDVQLLTKPLGDEINIVIGNPRGKPPYRARVAIEVSEEAKVGYYSIVFLGRGSDGSIREAVLELKVVANTSISILNITPASPTKGGYIHVWGKLVDNLGRPLDKMPVLLYLSKNKTCGGVFIGETYTANGTFSIKARVPVDIVAGDYWVIARFPGNNLYLPSSSDPRVRIRSPTLIHLENNNIVEVGSAVELRGVVTDIGGIPLANQQLSIYVGDIYSTRVITDRYGVFSVEIIFNRTGLYTLKARFEGTDLYFPAEAYDEIIVVELDLVQKSFIRGEQTKLSGTISPCDRIVGRELSIRIGDNYFNTSLREDCRFNVEIILGEEYDVGVIPLEISLSDARGVLSDEIVLRAKTRITLNSSEGSGFGGRVNITGCITDYYYPNIPIPHVSIILNGYRVVSDSRGRFSTTIAVPFAYQRDTYTIEAVFEGTEYYLPSDTKLDIKVFNLTAFLLVLAPLVVVAATLTLLAKKTRGKKRVAKLEHRVEKIKFISPQIPYPLPMVWEPGREIEIIARRIDGRETEFDYYINGRYVASGRSLVYTFGEKGTYRIVARDRYDEKAVGETELRIVDYREEIINLYNSVFLRWVANQGIDYRDLTPVEIKYGLEDRGFKLDPLSKITEIFILADYSLHDISREDFEEFYLALYQIGVFGDEQQ